eukprot:Nitzschia sp. Nitz4//scaffold76_size158648//55285//57377//NITZ4_002541-RA/size158648-processed-gene-0.236-mRNA-1//1//CDS//3329557830//1106//frame0
MTSLLSTGKKKAKASRVFGGDMFHEADISLCYSVSPGRYSEKTTNSEENTTSTPTPTVLFAENPAETSIQTQDPLQQDDKENAPSNVSFASQVTEDKNESFLSIRTAQLNRLRAAKSPLRTNMAKQTQEAINMATSSVAKTYETPQKVNKALNATRKAKKAALRERSKHTKTVRFQWNEENTKTKALYNRVEESRRQILAVQRKIASAHFKNKAQKDESEKFQRIAELDKASQFNSMVFREHQQKLREDHLKNRKKSMDARSKLRENKKEGTEKLDSIRRQEEEAIFEVRYDLHRARQEAKKEQATDRRKSYEFRGGDARRIKELRAEWQNKKLQEQQQSYELTRAADRDVDKYKQQVARDRRESIKGRNAEARKQRMEQQNEENTAANMEHASYELKWAGERDARKYERQLEEERRKSTQGRNRERARHAKVMEELRVLNNEKEAESFMLKFAAENDAKEYIQQLAKERRESLHLRGQEAKRKRNLEDEQKQQAVVSAIQEGVLQSECQKDVENYKKQMAEKARKSLQFRGKEKQVQRLEKESELQHERHRQHESHELDRMAHMDVDEYLKDCKNRRRKSLALRAKEKRRHAAWRQKREEKELEERQKSGYLQSMDYQHMAFAQQQERAKLAMDALRSAGCTLKGNPFGDLMGL